jgi:DNA-binding transcriptional LysR family regulator
LSKSKAIHWDDLRLALAVVRAGSVQRAARQLGVATSTVTRRLSALERSTGLTLFARSSAGLVPTEAFSATLGAATKFAEDLASLAEGNEIAEGVNAGLVTVTTVEILGGFVATQLRHLAGQHPNIRVRLRVGTQLLDLGRQEADIAIRVNPAPSSDLIGQRVAQADFAAYGARVAPKQRSDRSDRWIALDDDLKDNPQAIWEAKHLLPNSIVLRTSSRVAFIEAVRSGLGTGILPCAVGDLDPLLERRGDMLPSLRVPIWVLTHVSQKKVTRIRTVTSFLTKQLREAAR